MLMSWVPFPAPGPEVPGVQGHLVPSNHLHLPPASHLTHSSHCSKHSQGTHRFPVTHCPPPQLLVPTPFWGGKQLSPHPSQGATGQEATSSPLLSWLRPVYQSLFPLQCSEHV